jgi:hypothetical protein
LERSGDSVLVIVLPYGQVALVRAARSTLTLGGYSSNTKGMPFFKKRQSLTPDERLLGTWRLVKSDGGTDVGNGVTMTFMGNGRLLYVIHQNDSDEIMNLVFSVDGDHLVTNQPSRPQTESTRFLFDGEGHLVLDYGDSKTWFGRV